MTTQRPPRPRRRRCAHCATALPPESRTSRRYCGSRCRSSAWWDRKRHERRIAELIAFGGEQYLLSGVAPVRPRKTCPVCGKTWAAAITRADAVFCRTSCRKKAAKARRAARRSAH